MSLERVRQQIAAVEQQGKEQRRPQPQPEIKQTEEPKPPRPKTPDWGFVDPGAGSPTGEVHRGDCWATGRPLQEISRERAVAELADGAQACDVCRPQAVLGVPGAASRRTLDT